MQVYKPTKKGMTRGDLKEDERFVFTGYLGAVCFKTDGTVIEPYCHKTKDSFVKKCDEDVPTLICDESLRSMYPGAAQYLRGLGLKVIEV